MQRASTWALGALLLAGCASASPRQEGAPIPAPSTAKASPAPEPFASTYAPRAARPTLIRNATILTAAGPLLERGSILLADGKIVAVGREVSAPANAVVIDAAGKWVTPGVIDSHSHLGVYPSPGVDALAAGNEMTDPNTAEVWAEHSLWPQDPQFALALAGGVTSMQILPGSANLFGGRGVTVKNVPSRTMQGMKFPGAPHTLKMACGENPSRVYGGKGRAPSTGMGNVAGYRSAWIRAEKYRDEWKRWEAAGADPAKAPQRDLKLETLAGVLNGEILIQNHCYRADEMVVMLDVAHEFGYRIASFHHAVEAYKIRDYLVKEGVCSSMWADWWGFKMEAYDGIMQNVALVHEAGGCAIVHSDDAQGIQRLNQEAAKAMRAGAELGIDVAPEEAIRWITINPARAVGVDRWTGSLEPGKMADVVIWSGNPFSIYSRAEQVFIDGALLYDRSNPDLQPVSDFKLGNQPRKVVS